MILAILMIVLGFGGSAGAIVWAMLTASEGAR